MSVCLLRALFRAFKEETETIVNTEQAPEKQEEGAVVVSQDEGADQIAVPPKEGALKVPNQGAFEGATGTSTRMWDVCYICELLSC